MSGKLARSQNTVSSGEFASLPQEKVIYGAGRLTELSKEVDRLGCQRALLITGHSLATSTSLVKAAEELLGERHVGTYAGIRQHAPESGIAAALELARERQADMLVSIGGGSPIDAAKALARRLAESGGRYPPHIAIPTTLSAAEFSHISGYTDEKKKAKTGFWDPLVTPRVVILDPEMTVATPAWLWLSSGIRALDHAVETMYSPGFHPLSYVLALQAIQDLFTYLPRSKEDPADLEARLNLQLAAWMSFFAPLSVPMGLSHRIGRTIGASYEVPHGYTSCITLPHVMRYKVETDARQLARIAHALDLPAAKGPDREAALAAANAVAGLVERLGLVSRLQEVGVSKEAFERIASEAAGDTPLKQVVLDILARAW